MEGKRKDLYKTHAIFLSSCAEPAGESSRARRRVDRQANRKEKREELLCGKRMKLDEVDVDENDISVDEVIVLTKRLLTKPTDKESILKRLRQSFAQGTALIDAFLSVDNSMSCLIGLLTGLDAAVRLEAAWCLTNMAAGTNAHAKTVAERSGGYLVTYLASGNSSLQDQCAWALGNIAGSGEDGRSAIKAQEVIPALIKLLESPSQNVIKSAAFALSNLARDRQGQSEMIAAGVLPHLVPLLSITPQSVDLADHWNMLAEVCWVLTYLATTAGDSGSEGLIVLTTQGLLEGLLQLIIHVPEDANTSVQVLTPALRCVGNMLSGLDESRALREICECPGLMSALHRTIYSSKNSHIHKESLWLLSNLSVFSQACNEIISADLLPFIIHQLQSTSSHVRLEAAYCLCSMSKHGASVCEKLLSHGVLAAIVFHVKIMEPEVARLGLILIDAILSTQPQACTDFEECGGLTALEALEYCNNDELRSRTCYILETHFYSKEDEEVETY